MLRSEEEVKDVVSKPGKFWEEFLVEGSLLALYIPRCNNFDFRYSLTLVGNEWKQAMSFVLATNEFLTWFCRRTETNEKKCWYKHKELQSNNRNRAPGNFIHTEDIPNSFRFRFNLCLAQKENEKLHICWTFFDEEEKGILPRGDTISFLQQLYERKQQTRKCQKNFSNQTSKFCN